MSAPLYDPSAFVAFYAMMKAASAEEREKFVTKSKAMPYEEFLNTAYWGVIRGWIFGERKRCQFCGSTYALSVHHLTYEHRGVEWEHLEDLQLLCRECHKSKHGLASVEEVEKIRRRRLNAWRQTS